MTRAPQQNATANPALPGHALAQKQASWLRGARARLLRQAGVARRRRILDLGCGWADDAVEIRQASGGTVVAVDHDRQPLTGQLPAASDCHLVQARAQRLPFADGAFDLVFTQFAFLWFGHPSSVVREVHRTLTEDGVLAAIEPDYEGMIEHPHEVAVKDLWIAALRRLGADPKIARRLPGLLTESGFQSDVYLLDRLQPPNEARFDLLDELPLETSERIRLKEARAAASAAATAVAHLPLFLVLARKC